MQTMQSTGTERAGGGSGGSGGTRLESLTDKQRAVLDLLIEFKTSKEISRLLAISPHTVDQRVEAAKTKLGAGSRAELALLYRAMLGDDPTYERVTYEDSYVAEPPILAQNSSAVGTALAPPNDPGPSNIVVPDIITETDYRVVPELFDGRWGTVARLGTIVAFAALFCIAFLGGLAIFVQLSNMYRG